MSGVTRRKILLSGAAAGAFLAARRASAQAEPAPDEHPGDAPAQAGSGAHAGHGVPPDHGSHADHAAPPAHGSHSGHVPGAAGADHARHADPALHAAHAQHAHAVPAPVQVRRGPRPKPPGFVDSGRVITPNGTRLPWKVVGGVKVFHLIAEPIEHEPVPGLRITAWGYNGRTPGPTIEVDEGDRCRFYVTNRLPEVTSVHWHGVFLPNGMDGVAGLTQRAIEPGETYVYEFTMTRPGTFMYHPHADEMVQIALGMQGIIVVHPRAAASRPARDYALMLHEWKVEAGASTPDPLAMNDFNLLTINGMAFPGTEPLVAQSGERVRIRFANLSPMDHHPLHLHGHAFEVIETDGGPVPRSARWPETTVIVPVGAVRVVEFEAGAPGDWPLHCHMTHHVMNQMGHTVNNAIGADLRAADDALRKVLPGYMTMGTTGMAAMGEMSMPVPDNSVPMKGLRGPFGLIDMGGMFTLLKVRTRLAGEGDPGWYAHPKATVATVATAAQLQRDGIDPDPS